MKSSSSETNGIETAHFLLQKIHSENEDDNDNDSDEAIKAA